MTSKKSILLMGLMCLLTISLLSQEKINLQEKLLENKIHAVGRTISVYGEPSAAIEMDAIKSDGLGILEDVEFETGEIDIELLGENNPGKSFIGIAFNIQNDSTYEVIYFRPFNFVAEEQIRKDHMLQYVFHPEYTWYKLRDERTGEFEDEIPDPPDPDDWFKAIIKISDGEVQVFMEGKSEPVLSIERLTTIKSNKIGVWTGYGSSGRYRNLVITRD